VNQRTMQAKDLEGTIAVLTAEAAHTDADLHALRENEKQLHASLDESQALLRSTYAEIERLQGLLNMIYRSTTWKLHTFVERMRGR
jgi:chromosome segregation ATPase